MIEHGLLIDDETARLCAAKGIVISTQFTIFRQGADIPAMSEENRRKLRQVQAGQENLTALIKKYGIKIGFGTDFIFGTHPRVNEEFAARAHFFTPAEILVQATSESAEIVRMAGELDRHGNFGEIREGWLADLLLIEGEPFEDVGVLVDAGRALAVVMKAGKLYKGGR